MDSLQNFNYNGQVIQRRSDGFVSLTQMCSANGKRLDVFMKAKKTQEYIDELSHSLQMVVVDASEGGDHSGTWGHPSLAINLARWISPQFAVWCDAHIFNLMVTGKTSLAEDPIDKMIKLEELRFKNNRLACDMATMHGKEFADLVIGRADAVVEVERPVLEVIDKRCGDRRRGMTFTQLNEYLAEKTGRGFKSGSAFQRFIEKERPDLVDMVQRPVNQGFVHEENVKAVMEVAMKQPQQLRLGE
jgi:hypothetical protein